MTHTGDKCKKSLDRPISFKTSTMEVLTTAYTENAHILKNKNKLQQRQKSERSCGRKLQTESMANEWEREKQKCLVLSVQIIQHSHSICVYLSGRNLITSYFGVV